MKTIKEIQEEILETAHLSSSGDLARQYFKDSGINIKDLELYDFQGLAYFINKEIDILVNDPEYRMIPLLIVKDKIKRNKDGVFLRCSGSYFKDREAISFWHEKSEFIGFCGELNGCNRTPFIKGFIRWINFLLGKND